MTSAAYDFVGNRFIAASWRPGADERVLKRLRSAIDGWSIAEGAGWLLASEKPEAFASTPSIAVSLGRRSTFDRSAAAFRSPAEVATALDAQGAAAIYDMAPPFRAVWADRPKAALRAETDVFGLGQVFVGNGVGVALTASSATLLADVLAAPTSAERLAGYALFGSFIREETPFEGIDKLLAGACAHLADGRLEISERPAARHAGSDLTAAFQAAVAAMLKAAPDAELELSGGLDSRLILAAMTPDERHGRKAITIGVAGEPSEDVTVARALAESEQLDWSLLDAGSIASLDADGLAELLRAATIAYDHMANPLDKAALIAASQGRRVEARFGGQNGEILRGFYYPAQPLDAAPSEALARNLISMRLQANDRVEDAALSPLAQRDLRAAAEQRMVGVLMSHEGPWGRALDEFYLNQRMQNWVGNATGHRLMDHAPLYPFFDPAFVSAAMAQSSTAKLNSRAAYRLLQALDGDLAKRPLAGGIVPARAISTGRVTDLWLNAQRVSSRVLRSLRGRARNTLGSQTVTQHWRRLNLNAGLPVDRLSATGLFNRASLQEFADGTRLPSRATLGFLLLMSSLEARP
ncbi:asparagine synthase-related protein [Phenylobacterium kunshanense]|uniref:Asparagine synthetase domain-containing protein n=1 Tax=Phenylobacterium kunshanense TaxID=1445034 RepID=A0A328BNF9_9CAUL|nr:asparagine synthase-related protein [Phenylobacterium kunshanense]RAK66538.1 hypothetical protein DJ019_09885 [Phenylobacterium kunshanense]